MTTKFIGVKEFRANIAQYAKRAQSGKTRFVVMHRNKPLFEVKPFAENEGLEAVFADILKAEEDVRKGRLYTQEEIMAEFA
jgi:antitoxin (DNA-binding transcriptional repressor) of toxin-antitoxin stability system